MTLTPTTSLNEANAVLRSRLDQAGLPDSHHEARLLLCFCCALETIDLIRSPERALGTHATWLSDCLARRLSGEPITRIIGSRGFWTLDLLVEPNVLDPRADSEVLIEAMLEAFSARRMDALKIVDLGTGSGALLCAALAEFPNATGLGLDRSIEACQSAIKNLARNGLDQRGRIQQADWASLSGPFDIIVSNPPYIPSQEIPNLDRAVRDFDPLAALDGGADGLEPYRQIAPLAATCLAPHGRLILEFGATQANDVSAILQQYGIEPLKTYKDLGGHNRAIVGRLAAEGVG